MNTNPPFSTQEAQDLAMNLFGIIGAVSPLPSYKDQNFLIQSEVGRDAVLKIAHPAEDFQLIEVQQKAMKLASQAGCPCPEVISALSGSDWEVVEKAGNNYVVWCISYMSGKELGHIPYQSDQLLHDWGHTLGVLDQALLGFQSPLLNRSFVWNLSDAETVVAERLGLIAVPEVRNWVEKMLIAYRSIPETVWAKLQWSTIHNDANDYNLLAIHERGAENGKWTISAVLDFGDMVWAPTINELAIAAAYACLDKEDPLRAISLLAQGYFSVNPLEEEALEVLFVLVCMRLCVSICMAAQEQRLRPDDPYIAVSQAPIRRTIPHLAKLPTSVATAYLRQSCGFPVTRTSPRILAALKRSTEETRKFPVLAGLDPDQVLVLDLGIDSHLISGDSAQNTAEMLGKRIRLAIEARHAQVGIGQYNEPRLLYTAPFFKTGGGITDETRTIHLGLDFFAPEGTAVCSPLDGEIFTFAFNGQPQDYGGVLLLKHLTPEGDPFYTLFGHLSIASLTHKYIGQKVVQGEVLGYLGSVSENVGWPPHLHFQVILDDFGLGTDFPGVALASQRVFWTAMCPDPNVICGIAPINFPKPKTPKAETLKKRKQVLGQNLSIGYHEPVKVLRGWKQYLYDESGRCYLDGYNNVPHVGHAHPRVVEAATRQMRVLNTNTRYLHDAILEYATALCETLPPSLSVCYFLNSASEANELALRMARAYTHRKDILVMEAAYHGHTTSLIDLSPYKHNGPGGSGPPNWVHTILLPDVYRGRYKADDPFAGLKYARMVQEKIADLQSQGIEISGFIAETCPSVGGQLFLPEGYLSAVYQMVRAAGGLCIADEVQTGLGRIGTHFWAFQAHQVVPDMVIMGKPLGNGHPIGALVTTPEIANAFNNGMEFFSTFGGNPVSCSVGKTVLEVVQEENLMNHAQKVGTQLWAEIKTLQTEFPLMGDVRGSGLFGGIELVRDERLTPANHEARYVVNRMRDRGILIGTDGPYHNVVKIRPPMTFDTQNATLLVERLREVMVELYR